MKLLGAVYIISGIVCLLVGLYNVLHIGISWYNCITLPCALYFITYGIFLIFRKVR